MVEAYRKIRNTLRYLASNLYDFDPVDRVPLDRMEEVDRYALARYAVAANTVVDAYARFDAETANAAQKAEQKAERGAIRRARR